MRTLACLVALSFALPALPGLAQDAVLSPAGAEQSVAAAEIGAEGGQVSGQIENRTGHEVRAVRLLIQQVYRWPNEFQPGGENPSRAASVRVEGPIAPGATLRFSHDLGPLPELPGTFETRVDVMGFEEILPPARRETSD
jgi:hypothetical protein